MIYFEHVPFPKKQIYSVILRVWHWCKGKQTAQKREFLNKQYTK